ncbi:MAG: TolC family outer membrane protein [Acidobacteria bacterium]|nr:TolC family outer membrane protein [Acidobacteriota bacterium]
MLKKTILEKTQAMSSKLCLYLRAVTVAMTGTGWCFMGPVCAEDLLSIYQLAERKDAQLKQAEATYASVLELKPQARAQLLPSVGVKASVGQNFQDITQDISSVATDLPGKTDFLGWEYLLSLTQPVYRYDTYVQYQQADHRIRQAYLEFGAAQQDLIIRVAESYFAALAAMDNLEFVKAEKATLSEQLKSATSRFQEGLGTIIDVQEAQAGYDQSVASEIEAVNLLEDAQEALRELTGEYPKALLKLRETILLIAPEPADVVQWTEKALDQNLRVNAASEATEVARQEIARQGAGHHPTLDFVVSHGTISTGGRFEDVESDETEVGLEFKLPLFQGGLVNSQTREAQDLYRKALWVLEQERRAAHRQAHTAYLGVVAGISSVKALKQAVISNQTSLDANQVGSKIGTRTGLDVVNAQRLLLQAQRDYAQARYSYIVNTLRLKLAAATLAPADLNKINAWLTQ